MTYVSASKVEVLKSFWHVMREAGHVEREVVVRLPGGEVEIFQDGTKYTPKEALAAYLAEVS